MDTEPLVCCECIVWRERTSRCELWTVNGLPHLRVFNGPTLELEECPPQGTVFDRALALRAAYAGTRSGDSS